MQKNLDHIPKNKNVDESSKRNKNKYIYNIRKKNNDIIVKI